MSDKHILIIGGGITGLSTAYHLQKAGHKKITLVEAGPTLGGKIKTEHVGGFTIETGPDSFVTTKPYAVDLITELGMATDMISPTTSRFFILKDGKLHDAPRGLRMMVPQDESVLKDSTLFSAHGRARIFQEKEIAPRINEEDESFASFVTRRFGEEMMENYAEPLFGGIYSTPSDELSMQAAFPQFLAMEHKYGSISDAVAAQPPLNQEEGRSAFMSMRRGMGSLIDALVKAIPQVQVHTNTLIASIQKHDTGWEVFANGISWMVDRLVIALPSATTADLLRPFATDLAESLDVFQTASSHIVTLAYQKKDIPDPITATGYVVAKAEPVEVTASTWTSAKWPDRAPNDSVLLRCFFGKAGSVAPNEYLLTEARHEMERLLHIQADPVLTRISHWPNALPQYRVGHKDRVAQVRELEADQKNLVLAGPYFEGVGIPDCIRQGMQAAEKALQGLA